LCSAAQDRSAVRSGALQPQNNCILELRHPTSDPLHRCIPEPTARLNAGRPTTRDRGIALALARSGDLECEFESLLFGVSGHDPLTLAGAAMLFVTVAAAAAAIPARAASRVDPVASLRQ
jgi:hypothetical protein